MRNIYSDPEHWATVQLIDLTFVQPDHWIIGGFQVQESFQRQGHGGRLFQQVLDDADREGAILLLSAYGSDDERFGLTHEQLYAFYERRGFVHHSDGRPHEYIRYPREQTMTDTHDHAVKLLPAKRLDHTHVLIGESGGLSTVYSVEDGAMGGLAVETEHGTLYLNHEDEVSVLDYPDPEQDEAADPGEHTNVQQYTADRMAEQWAEGDAITKQQVADLQAAARRIIIHAHEVARLEAQESLSDWLTPEETNEVSEADVQYVKDWLTDWFEGH